MALALLRKAIHRLRLEFAIDNLDFDASTAVFGMLDWRITFGHDSNRCIRSQPAFLAFRTALFLAMLATTLWSFGDMAADGDGLFWFIYLTHWGLLAECAYLALAVYTTHMSATRWGEDMDRGLPVYVQAMWFLYAIVLPASFVIVVMYWLLVFEGELRLLSVLTHGLNFVVMVLDSVVGRMPYLLLHGLYFMLFATVYLLWSIVHYVLDIGNQGGDSYIYSSLDWGMPEAASMLSAMVLLVAPVLNIMFWVFVNLSNSCCGCCSTMSSATRRPGVEVVVGVKAVELDAAGGDTNDDDDGIARREMRARVEA